MNYWIYWDTIERANSFTGLIDMNPDIYNDVLLTKVYFFNNPYMIAVDTDTIYNLTSVTLNKSPQYTGVGKFI